MVKRLKKSTDKKAPSTTDSRSSRGRYEYSVVEELIQNPRYFGYRGGRVEVFDTLSDEYKENGYASYEARFMVPEEMYQKFCDLFDEQSSDLPVFIRWTEPEHIPARVPSRRGL